jgi:hypothetical protein
MPKIILLHVEPITKLPKFRNRDGSLSSYSFACGYIEQFRKDGIHVTLEKDGCFHIKSYDFNNHERLLWETTNSLTAARKMYKKEVSRVKNL